DVPTTGQPTVPDEVPVGTGRANTRGTLAFARLPTFNDANGNGVQDPGEATIPGGGPDSATSGFFVNLGDNSANLDNQNGGFDVFGQIASGTDANGQPAADPVSVIDALSQLQDVNRTIDDAVVLEPNVTFTAVSSNDAAIHPVNPTDATGEMGLQFNGPV